MNKKMNKAAVKVLLLLPGLFFCAPVLFLLSGSILSRQELRESLLRSEERRVGKEGED